MKPALIKHQVTACTAKRLDKLKEKFSEEIYIDFIEEIEVEERMTLDDGSSELIGDTNVACAPCNYEIRDELKSYSSATQLETDLAKIPSFFEPHQSALKTCIIHQHILGPVGKSFVRKKIAKYDVYVYHRLRVSTHS